MEEVVISVEVSTIFVSWLLCVTKFVVKAKLEHLNKKSSDQNKAKLQGGN